MGKTIGLVFKAKKAAPKKDETKKDETPKKDAE